MTRELCDIKELSAYLKISIPEIRKLIREKRIPYFKINTALRFDLKKINEWIDELEKKEQQNVLYY